ncbi:MAG TPA: NUDIX domain-containing protein [Steroidobacteraceae bacterium]|nr:NUDIX domain-containing protein [Steroidobacteraceae bacterium]
MPERTARAPRLSAGVVVVRRGPTGWLFLMLRAYRNWDFPKGVLEPGEEPLAAARREVREETLINDLQFTWGEEYRETAPYSNNKVARYYVGETHTERVTLPVSPELGRPEHNESRWLDLAGALSLASPRVAPVVRWAAGKLGIADESA